MMCTATRRLSAGSGSAFADAGKKLDMGKSCVRFKKLDDLPLDVIAETIARTPVDKYIEGYESVRGSSRKTRSAGAVQDV